MPTSPDIMQTKKIMLITGGSSGLGEAMGREFQARGFRVGVIARNRPKSDFDWFFPCDLGNAEERKELIIKLIQQFDHLDVFINNAGIGSYATGRELSMEQLRNLFEIDYFAAVELANAIAPLLEKSQGTLINIASIAGLMPVACMGAYSSAKAALYFFSESFRMENAGKFHLLTVCPGRINTGFSKRAICIRSVPDTPGGHSSGAQILARKVFRAYTKNTPRLIYPAWYRLAVWFSRFAPRTYARGNRKVWKLQ